VTPEKRGTAERAEARRLLPPLRSPSCAQRGDNEENLVKRLEGNVALVTSGASGIGLATAKLFVAAGAYVFITAVDQQELIAAVRSIGSNVSGVRADGSDPDELNRVIDRIKREKGRLDIVFASAGIRIHASGRPMDEELHHSLCHVNVLDLLSTVQTALPLMPVGGSLILNAFIVASKELAASALSM
jgi:NAD(P)-dependent dehydrogenase (short-subunit alcohol dehydrogenase family)